MRLMKIRPRYFRAFGNSEWINLNSDLVVIYGPSGFGKTSLAEALEWLFYGKTHRRSRGEELSQRDYQGSYRNAHAPVDEVTFIECEVRLQFGSIHTIKRELTIGNRGAESSATFIDGNPSNFNAIGLSEDEVFYPIIAQHSLQDFIHSRPKDRRDKISAAFGLEPLVRYKTVFDRARTRFQTSPPSDVVTARTQLNIITRTMLSAVQLTTLREEWSSGDIDRRRDAAEILRLAREFLQREYTDWDTTISELMSRRTEAARRVFDISPIQVPANLDQNLVRFRTQVGQIHTRVEALSHSLRTFTSSVATLYSQTQFQFWQTGLTLAPAGGDQCPMCESNTLTSAKRTELQERIDQSANYTQSSDDLQQESNFAATFIQEIVSLARLVCPAFLNDQQRQILLTLYQSDEHLCTPYLNSHDTLRETLQQNEWVLQNLAQQVVQISNLASHPDTIQNAISLVENLENDISTAIQRIVNTSGSYARIFSSFLRELEERISSSDEVREIDSYLGFPEKVLSDHIVCKTSPITVKIR